jgi:hypothetical protein
VVKLLDGASALICVPAFCEPPIVVEVVLGLPVLSPPLLPLWELL